MVYAEKSSKRGGLGLGLGFFLGGGGWKVDVLVQKRVRFLGL